MPCNRVGALSEIECLTSLVSCLASNKFVIKALWSADSHAALQVAANNNISCVASAADEVLLRAGIDLVIIACRPSVQANIAQKALGIGKHVLCLYPCAVSLKESEKLTQSAQYYPQIMALSGCVLRSLSLMQKARGLISEGLVGDIQLCEVQVQTATLYDPTHFDWLWEGVSGGGVLNLIGTHLIDLLQFLTQQSAVRVQAVFSCFPDKSNQKISESDLNNNSFRRQNSENFASFTLQLDANSQNSLAVFKLNSIGGDLNAAYYDQSIKISGSRGYLRLNNLQLYQKLIEETDEKLVFSEIYSPNKEQNQSQLCCVTKPHSKFEIYRLATEKMLKSLAATLDTSNKDADNSKGPNQSSVRLPDNIATVSEAFYAQAVVHAIREANRLGTWVNVRANDNAYV